jgi:hypothetical protein
VKGSACSGAGAEKSIACERCSTERFWKELLQHCPFKYKKTPRHNHSLVMGVTAKGYSRGYAFSH